MRHSLLLIPVLLFSVARAQSQSLLPRHGRIVARVGGTAPGLLPGERFGGSNPFLTPVISGDGQLLFRGRLAQGGTVTWLNDRALFLGRSASDLAVVARAGDPEPTGAFPNSTYQFVSLTTGALGGSDTFRGYRIDPTGTTILFAAQLYDGGNPGMDGLLHAPPDVANDSVIFYGAPGALQILVRQNATLLPGGARITNRLHVTSIERVALNSAGQAVFQCSLTGGDVTGPDNDTAWVIGTPGALDYLVREGDALAGGTIAVGQLGGTCWLNDSGIAFLDAKLSTTLGTTPATSSTDDVILWTDGTTCHVLAREGDPATDATGAPIPGVTLGAPGIASGLTAEGRGAFHVTLQGAVTNQTARAIYEVDASGIRLLVRAGETVAGANDAALRVLSSSVAYTERLGAFFPATLVQSPVTGTTSANDSVLCAARFGQPLTLFAQRGDPCPGMPGFTFDGFGFPRANDRGQAMFGAIARQGSTALDTLWSWDPVRGLELQLRAHGTLGDTLAGGTVVVAEPPLGGPSGNGNSIGWNGSGEFAVEPSLMLAGSVIMRGSVGFGVEPATTESICPSAAILEVDGTPTLGGEFTIKLGGATGTPFVGLGFAPHLVLPTPCGCSILDAGLGLAAFVPGTDWSVRLPYEPALLGLRVDCQGIELFPQIGGCQIVGVPFAATDIWTVTIG